jgi:hypothetical protein
VPDDLRYALRLLAEKRRGTSDLRVAGYDELRDYERGLQPIMFATPKFEKFYRAVMRRYRLNLCRPVVRQTARRLDVDAWEGDDAANGWWKEHGLYLQNRLYREMVRQGDAYTLTWPQGTMQGRLKTNRLRADEAIVVYSEEDPDTPEYGVKVWTATVDGHRQLRANVYRYDPPAVTRWITRTFTGRLEDAAEARWDQFTDDGDHEIRYDGPVLDAALDGVLPLQHFPCQPDDTPYGTSVLADVLPVQDALNKHAIDILVTSEQYGLPLRALLGMEEIRDSYADDQGVVHETSNLDDIDYDPRIDYLFAVSGSDAKLIQLPAADLSQLLEVKRAAIQDATLASNVPLSLLMEDSGNIPAGVALREVKAPLAELVEDIQQDATRPWANVARLYGLDAQPMWSAPFQQDEMERWELATLKVEAGWPARQAFIETGLDAEFVDEVFAEASAAQNDVGGMLMRAFRDGRDPADVLNDGGEVRQ